MRNELRHSFFEPLETRQLMSVTPVGVTSEAPSGLVATKIDIDRVTLSWKDNCTREIGFYVNCSKDGGKTWQSATVSGANLTTILFKGLDEGSKVVFRVQAALAKKQVTAFSPNLAVFTLPKAPSGLLASASGARVDLTWNDSSAHETGERIERSTDGKNFAALVTVGKNIEAFSDKSVSGGVNYWYRVIATGGGKDSAASNVVKILPLAAPKTMTATAFSSSRIDLKWSAVTGAVNYDLQCLFDTSWKSIVTLDSKTLGYSNTGRYPATQYSYRVRAFSANARSAFASASATTVPDAPSAVAANNMAAGQITLGWNPVAGATGGYSIERRIGTDDFGPIPTVEGADTSEYVDSNLDENIKYEYRIRAIGDAGKSAYSKSVNTRTALNAPTDVTATVWSGSEVYMTWTDHSDAEDQFIIEASTDGGETWDWIGDAPTDFPGMLVNTHGSKTYDFRVHTATNDGGRSEDCLSNEVTTPLAKPLIDAKASNAGITISWEDCGDDAGYVIERAVGDGDFAPLATLDPDVTQYLDSDVSAGVTYCYHVAATGEDQQQTPFSYPAQAMAFVEAPSDLQIVSTTANSISLSWTIHTTGVPNYVLLFNDGTEGQGIIVLPNDATSYTLQGLELNRSYTFKIAAIDDMGNAVSDASNIVEYATPSGPNGFGAYGPSTSEIDLAWTDNSGGAFGFIIERSSDGQQWEQIATLGPGSTTYADMNLAEGGTWYYRVREVGSENATPACQAHTWLAMATDMTAQAISSNQVEISWTDNSEHEDGYVVGLLYNGEMHEFTTVEMNTTQFTVNLNDVLSPEQVQAGAKYDFYVRPYGNGFSADNSETASATLPVE